MSQSSQASASSQQTVVNDGRSISGLSTTVGVSIPSWWVELLEHATYGVVASDGMADQLLRDHFRNGDNYCIKCSQVSITRWPCPIARVAFYARALGGL